MADIRDLLKAHDVPADSLRPLFGKDQPGHMITVPGADALEVWGGLHEATERSGIYPAILGKAEELDMGTRLEIVSESPDEIIRASMDVRVPKWLAQRMEMDPELFEIESGDWPDDGANTTITSVYDLLTQEFLPEVGLALVPTRRSWEVPAYLRFGGENDCPQPFEHVAFWQHWQRTYGAHIAAMTHDVVEAVVDRPPTTREAAMALAREQFGYCYDIVAQGTETLEALAAALLNGEAWYFWWD